MSNIRDLFASTKIEALCRKRQLVVARVDTSVADVLQVKIASEEF